MTDYATKEFAEHLATAAHAGEKLDALAARIEDLHRKFSEISQKLAVDGTGMSKGSRGVYTTREVSRLLSVHVVTVRIWIAKGYLPVVFFGSARRIPHEGVAKLIKFGLPKVWPDKQKASSNGKDEK